MRIAPLKFFNTFLHNLLFKCFVLFFVLDFFQFVPDVQKCFAHPASPGPNPLLISVIEELVRGEASPVIRVMSGESAPAEEGFEFTPRPQPQIDWTALLFSDKGAQGTGDE